MLLQEVGGFARSSFIETRFVAGRIAPVRMSSASPLGLIFFFFTVMLIGSNPATD
jgi:hypothetical protein